MSKPHLLRVFIDARLIRDREDGEDGFVEVSPLWYIREYDGSMVPAIEHIRLNGWPLIFREGGDRARLVYETN